MGKKLVKALSETWFFWAFFLCLGFVSRLDEENYRVPPQVRMVANLAFSFLLALWVVTDARRRASPLGFSFPALVFFFWPVFVPFYLFQSRGVRAFLTLLCFGVMFIVAFCLGAVLRMLAPS
ncbi:MAG: hypothetical protein HY301_14295 [Verrucomicrobia bacterium]|nr:hypothetical protein [Verrucomicrobiota bacterium]